jgi:hypothetical protein
LNLCAAGTFEHLKGTRNGTGMSAAHVEWTAPYSDLRRIARPPIARRQSRSERKIRTYDIVMLNSFQHPWSGGATGEQLTARDGC